MGAVIMVQGTSSDAGKSVFCAALCRYYADQGLRVAPFKAQNMALNAMAVPGGGEIGWAQVMQAEAARTTPTVQMNPVLLKPVSDTVCQVVVSGRAVKNMDALEYQAYKETAFISVLAALDDLRSRFDLVVIEGAGSPAEVNLREHDIVNMRLANAAEAPVLLISDIDRGGMFAYVAGTMALLNEEEKHRVKGVVVNRFRGMADRLQPGLQMLQNIINKPVIGVMPHVNGLSLPAEDSLGLQLNQDKDWLLDVAVIQLPRISNFTDYHVLAEEEGVRVRYVSTPREIGQAHIVILPGTKNTLADLAWLKENGFPAALKAAGQRGAYIVGICGGYQMLGETLCDPEGIDGAGGTHRGLGLLALETTFLPQKTTIRVTGHTLREEEKLEGYEIHLGQTKRLHAEAFARLLSEEGRVYEDGAISSDGKIIGTYLHGLFDAPEFRQGFLQRVRHAFGLPVTETIPGVSARQKRERSYQLLADTLHECVDMDFITKLLKC